MILLFPWFVIFKFSKRSRLGVPRLAAVRIVNFFVKRKLRIAVYNQSVKSYTRLRRKLNLHGLKDVLVVFDAKRYVRKNRLKLFYISMRDFFIVYKGSWILFFLLNFKLRG